MKHWLGYTDMHWIRVQMDKATRARIRADDPQSKVVLEVGGDAWSDFGFKHYESLNYPDYDICDAPAAIGRYDLVIAEQVLEHLLWPRRAVENAFAMLRPGGVFLATTPFLVRVHQHPVDCSRWTDLGLKYLLADGGFDLDQIEVGQWGNRSCASKSLNPRWQKWIRWHPLLHSLANHPLYPVSVWAFATKPGPRG